MPKISASLEYDRLTFPRVGWENEKSGNDPDNVTVDQSSDDATQTVVPTGFPKMAITKISLRIFLDISSLLVDR
jgi:hypothetical protein